MNLRVDPSLPTPPSRQIVEAVLDQIASGTLQPGDRLPSVRGLAAEALVNPNTVNKAYRDLEALGAVEGRSGAGVFVCAAGPVVAREERHQATLERVREAIATALGAGHDAATIAAVVRELVVPSPARFSEVSPPPEPREGSAAAAPGPLAPPTDAKQLRFEPGSVRRS